MQAELTPGAGFAADLADQPSALGRVLEVNTEALERGRDLLGAARTVRLLGLGSSRHAAGIGAAALELAGTQADVPPAPGDAVPAPVLHPDDLVVAVSQSGQTPALLTAVSRAKARGCRVIAVTNGSGALARLAHISLDCASGPERVVAASKSVTTSVLLLRALAGEVEVSSLVTAVRDLLAADASALVAGAHPTHVVAGGLGAEWVAAEVALKFAETGGRLLTAEPLVEHLHGPIAAPATVLALVHPRDPNAAALQGDVVRIGPGPTSALPVADLLDPACAAVLNLVIGQVAALAWARRTGVDADAPRGLSKVTRSA